MFPVFRIRILRKNKANNTVTLEKMEGQPDREQLFECNGIQNTSVEQNKGSLVPAYHSFSIRKALSSAVRKMA